MNILDLPPDVDPDNIMDDIDYEKAVEEDNAQTLYTIGKKEFDKLDKPLSQQLTEIFEILMPGNGEIATIFWTSAIGTVLGNPNMGIITGNPGEGKTILMDYILNFIPKRHVLRMNDLTESGLFQTANVKGINYLDKKIVYLGDLGDRRGFEKTLPARKILRTLQTDGYFARTISEKRKDENNLMVWEAQEQILTGKPAMWFSTVREDGDAQDKDRSIICTTNLEKEKEIKYIIQHIKNPKSKTGKKIRDTISHWQPILCAIFEYIISNDVDVIIPWDISELDYKFRDIDRLITLTQLLALINKPYHDTYNNYILANEWDITAVAKFLNEGNADLSAVVMKRLKILYGNYKHNDFSRMDAVLTFPDTYPTGSIGNTASIYRDILQPAIKAGFIQEDKDGRQFIYNFIQSPTNTKFTLDLPEIDWEMIKEEYGEDEGYSPISLEYAQKDQDTDPMIEDMLNKYEWANEKKE